MPHEHIGLDDVHHVRVAFWQDGVSLESVGLHDLHDVPVMTRVEFSLLWLVGIVYFFISAPAGMTPFPVAAGWVIIGTTLFSLVVLARRFPLFGYFLVGVLSGLMRGGRRRW